MDATKACLNPPYVQTFTKCTAFIVEISIGLRSELMLHGPIVDDDNGAAEAAAAKRPPGSVWEDCRSSFVIRFTPLPFQVLTFGGTVGPVQSANQHQGQAVRNRTVSDYAAIPARAMFIESGFMYVNYEAARGVRGIMSIMYARACAQPVHVPQCFEILLEYQWNNTEKCYQCNRYEP